MEECDSPTKPVNGLKTVQRARAISGGLSACSRHCEKPPEVDCERGCLPRALRLCPMRACQMLAVTVRWRADGGLPSRVRLRGFCGRVKRPACSAGSCRKKPPPKRGGGLFERGHPRGSRREDDRCVLSGPGQPRPAHEEAIRGLLYAAVAARGQRSLCPLGNEGKEFNEVLRNAEDLWFHAVDRLHGNGGQLDRISLSDEPPHLACADEFPRPRGCTA